MYGTALPAWLAHASRSCFHGRVSRTRPRTTLIRTALVATLAAVLALTTYAAGTAFNQSRAVASQAHTGTYLVTEYFPVPERWFRGAPVTAHGLSGKHAQDFLWAPNGLTMEYDGVLRDGTRVHFVNDEGIDWVNKNGYATRPLANGHWSNGLPVSRDVGWRNANGQPTFQLATGKWSNGRGVVREPSPLRFASGPSEPFLRYWHTAAVDPKIIPLGSRIYIPHFRNAPNHGWFVAQDVGHTIIDHQIDVYVPPPARPDMDLEFSGKLVVKVFPPAGAT